MIMNEFELNEGPQSVDGIREVFYLFWSWLWVIITAGLLAGLMAYLVAMRTAPIYQTTTRLLVSDPPAMRSIDYTGIVSSQTMTRTYAEMLVERPVLQGVIDQIGLPKTPEQLRESISVELVRDTQLLVVSVEDRNPILAAETANTIAKVFTVRIRELQSQRYAATRES